MAYDYGDNLVTADVGTQIEESQSYTIPNFGATHTVVEGDTLYSLSRARCVSVSEIQQMNGIGADYGIKIGQTLTLPVTRC